MERIEEVSGTKQPPIPATANFSDAAVFRPSHDREVVFTTNSGDVHCYSIVDPADRNRFANNVIERAELRNGRGGELALITVSQVENFMVFTRNTLRNPLANDLFLFPIEIFNSVPLDDVLNVLGSPFRSFDLPEEGLVIKIRVPKDASTCSSLDFKLHNFLMADPLTQERFSGGELAMYERLKLLEKEGW